jgi:GAF domain-containing protein
MKIKPIYLLYCLAIVAFSLALLKYGFLYSDGSLSVKFFVIEILSFLSFLGVIYFSDKMIRLWNKERIKVVLDQQERINKYKNQIDQLRKTNDKLKADKSDKLNASQEVDVMAEKIKNHLKKQGNSAAYGRELLNQLAKYYEIGMGICYLSVEPSTNFVVKGVYGIDSDQVNGDCDLSCGLHGQAVSDKEPMFVKDIDVDYFQIESYSGAAKPRYLYFLPIIQHEKTVGLIELATFKPLGIEKHWKIMNSYIAESISYNN